MPLPETLVVGSSGHVGHSNTVHAKVNDLENLTLAAPGVLHSADGLHAAGGVYVGASAGFATAQVMLQNQGAGKYGLAIQPMGSNFNALYINYSHASDTDYGIGIDVGTGATGGILVDFAAGTTVQRGLLISGDSQNLIELRNDAGTSQLRFSSSGDILELANNTATRWYSDGYGTSVAEVKVDATDAGLANFWNRGVRTRHVAAATPTGGYSGEVAVGNGKIWVNDAGTWKSVAVA